MGNNFPNEKKRKKINEIVKFAIKINKSNKIHSFMELPTFVEHSHIHKRQYNAIKEEKKMC
jgi:hypothetical protein